MKKQMRASPTHDAPNIVVIGAGIAGLMSAFHLRRSLPQAQISVLEKGDYVPNPFGTSSRSAACSRQQFGCEHNVQMSLYSTRFYERFGEHTGEPMQMFWQRGYLFLYREAERFRQAEVRAASQLNLGVQDVSVLSPNDIAKRFPFQVDASVCGGTFCPTDGFLSVGTILQALKSWLLGNGVHIMTGLEVLGFEAPNGRVSKLVVDGATLPADWVVNATGAWASRLGNMLGTPLKVAPEKRYLWSAEFRNPSEDFCQTDFERIPLIVMNGNGITPYLKPEPGHSPHSFLLGCEHQVDPEWDFEDADQDKVGQEFLPPVGEGFVNAWQETASWLPFAESLGFRKKVNAGFYETTPPHNPVIGIDPRFQNVVHCCGFSGHGIMHGPAAGQMVADLVQFGDYRSFPKAEESVSCQAHLNGTGAVESMKI